LSARCRGRDSQARFLQWDRLRRLGKASRHIWIKSVAGDEGNLDQPLAIHLPVTGRAGAK